MLLGVRPRTEAEVEVYYKPMIASNSQIQINSIIVVVVRCTEGRGLGPAEAPTTK